MEKDNTEMLLDRIGELLAEDVEYPLDGTLLYAELDHNMVSPSIFKDRGNHILNRDADLNRLGMALLRLWDAQPSDNRWVELHYLIRDGRFEATYVYPDEIDPREEPMDRRSRIVAQYFGDKPEVYPQPEDDEDLFDL